MPRSPLLPGGVNQLTDEQRGIGSLPRPELLHAAAADRREVQVLFLVHADPVHAEERARPRTQPAPRVNQVALVVELRELD